MRWLLVVAFLVGVVVIISNVPSVKERRDLERAGQWIETEAKSHPTSQQTQSHIAEAPNPGEELRNGTLADWNKALPSIRFAAAKEMIFLSKRQDVSAANLMTCMNTTAESGSAAEVEVVKAAGICIAMLQ